MPKKQPTATVNVTSAAPARVAKPRTTRVTTATHSKTQAAELKAEKVETPKVETPKVETPKVETPKAEAPKAEVKISQTLEPKVAPPIVEEAPVASVTMAVETPDGYEAIAKLAYSYWEERGCQDGNPDEDWARAEAEYLKLSTSR